LVKNRKKLNFNDSFLGMEKEEIKYETVTYFKKNLDTETNENSYNEYLSEIKNKNNNNRNTNSKFLMKKRNYSKDENKFCQDLFNPKDSTSYYFVVNNWIKVKLISKKNI